MTRERFESGSSGNEIFSSVDSIRFANSKQDERLCGIKADGDYYTERPNRAGGTQADDKRKE